ncbi:MAG: hypothetical protein AAB819_02495 [Patescibacteria group bacterium]
MKLKFIDGGRLIRYTRPPRSPQGVEDSFNTLSGDELEQFRKVCVNLVDPQKYIAERLNEYGWTEEMLARADYFVPVKLPTPVPYFERPWCCFENSFNHAEQTGLLYVEGIAVSPSGISIHAWNSTNGSDVIDYTWPYQHVNKYFGIIFPIKWVKKHYSTPGGILNPKLLRTKPLPPW